MTVEKQATKEIPVRGEFIGTEADNCLAGAVTTDPETLVLKGPAKELEASPMPWQRWGEKRFGIP